MRFFLLSLQLMEFATFLCFILFYFSSRFSVFFSSPYLSFLQGASSPLSRLRRFPELLCFWGFLSVRFRSVARYITHLIFYGSKTNTKKMLISFCWSLDRFYFIAHDLTAEGYGKFRFVFAKNIDSDLLPNW